ncbi:ubiquinol oxidase subunit II [Sphingomonas astaxanthinifaciens]|uniref:Ubiquinol oxidase subunit 2 n=1 Tax=Sphingomonas astaxanthinifaciens DSM 22298 TaxID=1123267 RepID=A0ABQ5Z898_9SPHN|nr:ubiquinol oxidase subunit II [Sphingomonas astaxanthinifaciens]GLR47772.1 cytochrome ubiquinol oxidase subunit II [Sphingomonas astaxanthinifaciens DSM 22298]
MQLQTVSNRLKCAALAVCVLLLGACDRGVLNPAGDVARQQRDLIYISTALMLLIIVPVMVLIVVFAWRYRKGNGGTYDPKFDHSTSLELVIWSAPLLIIIALGALTWSSTHLLDPFRPINAKATALEGQAEKSLPPLRVQVVSLDWKWLFIYPEQGIATVNDLVLPLDRPVRFDITSSNMMNTFYAPTMAGMVYAMPGMQSTLHAVLDRPVDDQGYSGNYSGAGFSGMRFRIRGVSEQQFAGWIGQAKASGRTLDRATAIALLKPTEKVPPILFAAAEPDIYKRILERCLLPGQPCMSEVMAKDMGRGMHQGMAMPAGRGSAPIAGQKPEGALMKSPEEKGTGTNVGKPIDPSKAPGVTKPGDPANRNMS